MSIASEVSNRRGTVIYRRSLGVLALFAATGLAALAWMNSKTEFFTNTIHNNREQNTDFLRASLLVDEFYREHHRFPAAADVRSVSPDGQFVFQYSLPKTAQDVAEIPPHAKVVWYQISGDPATFSKEVLTEFGAPPISTAHPYLLIDPSVDVPVVWASWARRSNAPIDTEKFRYLATSRATISMLYVGALAMFCVAAYLWRTPRLVPKMQN